MGLHSCFFVTEKSIWKVVTERKSKWWRWGFADSWHLQYVTTVRSLLHPGTWIKWEDIFGWAPLWFRQRKAFWNISERKLPLVMGVRLEICREVCQSREDNFYFTKWWIRQEDTRELVLISDHTLVPTHYKQLTGQVWPVTFPQFQKEETCRTDLQRT